MDYKKKYEDALERAKRCYKYLSNLDGVVATMSKDFFEEAFPELKEGEDERIRKELINFFKNHMDSVYEEISDNNVVIAWLEKQGEQKLTNKVEPKFKVGDVIKNIDNGDTVKIEQILDNYYCYSGWDGAATIHSDFTISEQDNWELVEKKPTDKVEPKFKVGDWIISSEGMLRHIMYVDKSGYQTDYGWLTHDSYEREFHLWTIQDAKDGDVLANNGNIILFKEISNSARKDYKYIKSHCLALIHTFDFYTGGSYNLDDEFHPATKEQQDLLFSKMKEAGYEWDAEKKKLKKIEQKPTWDEKIKGLNELEAYILSLVPDRPLDAIKVDAKNIRYIINKEQKPKFYDSMDDLIADALIEEIENSDLDDRGKHNRIVWIKSHRQKPTNKIKPRFKLGDTIRPKGSMAEYTIESISGECYHGKGWGLSISCDEDYELVEQKPSWSEEDKKILDAIIKEIEANKAAGPEYDEKVYDMFLSWLTSLKDRVLPNPKQEWSEEDEMMFLNIIDNIQYVSENCYSKSLCDEEITWLKTLKERYTWKPTDEQIKALLKLEEMHVLEHEKNQENAHLYMVIKSLKEQLFKLKGE